MTGLGQSQKTADLIFTHKQKRISDSSSKGTECVLDCWVWSVPENNDYTTQPQTNRSNTKADLGFVLERHGGVPDACAGPVLENDEPRSRSKPKAAHLFVLNLKVRRAYLTTGPGQSQ